MVTEMDRILDIWDEELSSIVEIEKIGHRRRILLSVAGPAALHKRGEKKKMVVAPPAPKCEAHRRKSPTEELGTTQDAKRHSASGSELSVAAVERRYTSTSSASEGSSKPPTPSKTRKSVVETGTLTLGRRKKKAPLPPAGTGTGQPAKEDPVVPMQVSPQSRQRSSVSSTTTSKPVKIQTEVKKCSKHASTNVSTKLQPELPEVIDIPPPLAFSCSFQVQLSLFKDQADFYQSLF